jgi:hypothetical protein
VSAEGTLVVKAIYSKGGPNLNKNKAREEDRTGQEQSNCPKGHLTLDSVSQKTIRVLHLLDHVSIVHLLTAATWSLQQGQCDSRLFAVKKHKKRPKHKSLVIHGPSFASHLFERLHANKTKVN